MKSDVFNRDSARETPTNRSVIHAHKTNQKTHLVDYKQLIYAIVILFFFFISGFYMLSTTSKSSGIFLLTLTTILACLGTYQIIIEIRKNSLQRKQKYHDKEDQGVNTMSG
jgi:hypothetical protein